MAVELTDKGDGGKGAATIDMSEIEKGKKPAGLAGDLDNLDFGDEVEEEEAEEEAEEVVEKEKKAPKKTEKKVEKKTEKKAKEEPAEEEEAEEADEEEAEEEEEEAEEVKKAEVKVVPQARLMHVKTQRDRLAEEVRQLNEKLRTMAAESGNTRKAEEFEQHVSQLYIDVEKARAAGEVETAAKLQRELDKLKEESGGRRSEAIAQLAARNQLEQRLYDATVTQLELVAPQVNPDDENYDAELVSDLDAATRGYEAQGLSPSEALKKAAKRLISKDIFDPDKSIRREKQPEPKKTDIKKNTAAAKKTPPEAVKEERQEKTQVLKVSQMTRDEFNKLPEATQRRMLGDELE